MTRFAVEQAARRLHIAEGEMNGKADLTVEVCLSVR
jgi:hypothetical protein